MLEQLFTSLVAIITTFFGLPNGGEIAKTIEIAQPEIINVGDAECVDDFEPVYESGDFAATWGTDVLLQTCTSLGSRVELRTDTESVTNEENGHPYTLVYTSWTASTPTTIEVLLDSNPYGPSCSITEITSDTSGAWQSGIINCFAGDGGFSYESNYQFDFTNGQASKISSCNGRPLAILNANGDIATYSTIQDCTYPFGTTEEGPIE
jgi:hypothetical protein